VDIEICAREANETNTEAIRQQTEKNKNKSRDKLNNALLWLKYKD